MRVILSNSSQMFVLSHLICSSSETYMTHFPLCRGLWVRMWVRMAKKHTTITITTSSASSYRYHFYYLTKKQSLVRSPTASVFQNKRHLPNFVKCRLFPTSTERKTQIFKFISHKFLSLKLRIFTSLPARLFFPSMALICCSTDPTL